MNEETDLDRRQREIFEKAYAMGKRATPIRKKIMALVESQTGIDFGENLHIGFSLDMTYVGFDVWYQTDKELEIAKASGFDRKLTKILERSAREYLNAESNVGFHSHQTVLEKCGGDYFQYLR